MFKNFKIKISLWYASLFALIIAGTLFASYEIVSYQLLEEIKSNLQSKKEYIQHTIHTEHQMHEEAHAVNKRTEHSNEKKTKSYKLDFEEIELATDNANYFIRIYNTEGLVYYTPKYKELINHAEQVERHSDIINKVTIGDLPFFCTSIENTYYTIDIAYELSAVKSLQDKLLNIFIIALLISIILSLLCGFLVTQKTMNIIKRIDKTASNISSNNLNKRIILTEGNDEISHLIVTLNSMIDRLEKSFSQAKQFSQDAAHEIRTPLTIIRGEIEEIIESERDSKETITFLENILEEVHYLSSISERLLLIHNMDTKNIKYHFETLNMSNLVTDIYQDVQILSMEKNINVSCDIVENIMINGNKELLIRLLWNLSENAIKYNITNGSMSISLKKKDSQIQVMVKDSRYGIPTDDMSKIFNRFYRVDKSRSRQLGGSGLGLSICKWIVELHGGTICVKSKEGVGSEFVVTFNE